VISEKNAQPAIGNRLKAIDFIGSFELHGSKKRLIPEHKETSKTPNFRGFLWNSFEMTVKKLKKYSLDIFLGTCYSLRH